MGGVYVVNTKNRAPVIFVSKDMCTYLVLSGKFLIYLFQAFN